MDIITFAPGKLIFGESDRQLTGIYMYFIIEGSVEVIKKGKRIAVIKAGSPIGEMGFFTGAPRTATVMTMDEVKVVEITYKNLDEVASKYPEMGWNILKAMVNRTYPKSQI